MGAQKKTCFFMCPIKDLGSPANRNSRQVLEKILRSPLEKAGFKIEQFLDAEHREFNTSIYQRLDNWIRTADLCVVDLAGSNPNVLFEYGRRLGTGLPVLALAKKGQKLLFDVQDLHVIFYDLANPRETIRRIEAYLSDVTVEGSWISMVAERRQQTTEICQYIRRHNPRRIDVLQFSLRTLESDFFDALYRCSDVAVRLLLLNPNQAKKYALGEAHSEDVRLTEKQVKGLSKAIKAYGRNHPTVGLWYYDHEPGIATVLIDGKAVQAGWYLRERAAGRSRRVLVNGHNAPGVFATGASARTLVPVLQRHFDSVLRRAELASPAWGVSGPRKRELLDEWQALQQGARTPRQ